MSGSIVTSILRPSLGASRRSLKKELWLSLLMNETIAKSSYLQGLHLLQILKCDKLFLSLPQNC